MLTRLKSLDPRRIHPLELKPEDLDRIKHEVFFKKKVFSRPSKSMERTDISRFWILLVLSGIIAAAGVANDSTATVIGAMIVAPLMTPILGLALAFVLVDRQMLLRSAALTFFGATIVIVIGWIFGFLENIDSTILVNSQVTSRINPNLIDLGAAIATGLVGAFALVRSDISDTLPGVAIAISLVPPLAVCGLVLHDGEYQEAWGALLLFLTNVSAILAMGALTLSFYGIRDLAQKDGETLRDVSRRSVLILAAAISVAALFLWAGTTRIMEDQRIMRTATPIAEQWAASQGWVIVGLVMDSGALDVSALGEPPEIDANVLRTELDRAGLSHVDLDVSMMFGNERRLEGTPGS